MTLCAKGSGFSDSASTDKPLSSMAACHCAPSEHGHEFFEVATCWASGKYEC